jgi:hypothetical protein
MSLLPFAVGPRLKGQILGSYPLVLQPVEKCGLPLSFHQIPPKTLDKSRLGCLPVRTQVNYSHAWRAEPSRRRHYEFLWRENRKMQVRNAVYGLVAITGILCACPAQAPDDAKPSAYAPAADLIRQVKAYVESLTAATADASDYDEDKQGEVSRDANTLATMALVLGMHDQDNALKPAAAKLIAAAKQLSAEHEDAQKAAAAVAAIKAIVDKPEKGEAVSWKPCAEMVPLMKQVPIVNNKLRSGVEGRRFAQSADKNAALAATLAAIAQVSMLDTDYVSEAADRPIWVKASTAMRDGCADAISAIRIKSSNHVTSATTSSDPKNEWAAIGR